MSARESLLRRIWPPDRKPIVGMVHLRPLPGAPRWAGSMERVVERAVSDATALEAGGLDGVLVENYLDSPFHPASVPAETVAAMTAVAREVVRAVQVPVGVDVLRNDAPAAIAVAAAAGARFIRVNVHRGVMIGDQGWLVGRAHETLRLRERLGAPANGADPEAVPTGPACGGARRLQDRPSDPYDPPVTVQISNRARERRYRCGSSSPAATAGSRCCCIRC